MTNWYFGTMGFSWKDWKGIFYPENLEARDYLEYYSRIFNAVEIDSTYYGVPRKDTVRRWANVTPPGFQICAKFPKDITHDRKLVGAEAALDEYLETMRLLDDRLSVLLIQMPPSFTAYERPALEKFLKLLPNDIRFALEVRDVSWHTGETEQLLAEHKIAWTATEYEDLPKRIAVTSDFLYVRFIGRHGSFQSHESEKIDVTENLAWWKERLIEASTKVNEVYGFFNNDYAGFAAGTCNRFKAMVGLPLEPFTPPEQPRLF
jgi:uncharacterized protein YecE (DUF72 family)